MKSHASTIASRKTFTGSAKQLKRARRLYCRLIGSTVCAQPEALIPLAYRAQNAGLYSEKNGIRDICFFMLRAIYKTHNHQRTDWWSWSQTGLTIAYDHAKYWRREGDGIKAIKKPRVRIVRAAA